MIVEMVLKFRDMVVGIPLKFNEGGGFMWVLLIVLAIAVAIFIERLYFYLVTCKDVSPAESAKGAKALESNDTDALVAELRAKKDPLSPLIAIAIERTAADNDLDTIQDGIDEEALVQIPRISERINYLALIANVATLLGLLGTIAGLQDSFASLATAEAAEKATKLAAGISKAMNTTAFGLLVAIPCMVAYTYLNNAQKVLTRNVDDAMLRLVNYIKKSIA